MKNKKVIFAAFLLLLVLGTKADRGKMLAAQDPDWEDHRIDIFNIGEDVRLS